jgi:siroheme synthase-like protein
VSSALPLYPVALLLTGRRCLVVGAGPVAQRKVEGLLAAQAQVTVVAPEVVEEIAALPVRIERRPYERGEAAGYFLVITATGIPEIDRAVFADGDRAGVLVNAADDVPGCSFILPAVARRGDVTIAVSTGGRSPALAGWLRDGIESGLPGNLAALASLVAESRDAIRAAGRPSEGLPWRALLDGPLPELVAAGELERAHRLVARWIDRILDPTNQRRDAADRGPGADE